MSHKDAPPETESQKACREWWEKARPTVKRAWGRAQDGSFLAEETRLIHQAWEAASQQANAEVEKLRAEIDALRTRLEDTVRDSTNEIEALRTEAEQHLQQAMSNGAKARAAQAQANNLRTEIEALRAEVDRLHEQLRLATVDQVNAEAEANDARSENERLAKALEQCITSMLDSGYRTDSVVIRAAREALATKQQEPTT